MLLGIDIGTSTVAAVIADGEGRILAKTSRRHGADSPAAPGRAEQDAARLLEAAFETICELPADLRREVRAVGATGQMHGVVTLDGAGEPLTPLITWQDGRCLEDAGFLDELNARTGCALRAGFGCATLAWMRARGALPPGAEATATIHDLLVARLCGVARPVTDPTDAASWGLFDLAARNWDWAAVAAAGISRELLPEVKPRGERAGALADRPAAALGLPPGIPVCVALGDNQASLLATLLEPERELALTLGTGGQLSAVLPDGTPPGWALECPSCECRPYPGGRLAVVAAPLCGGAAWGWLADSAESWLRELGAPTPLREELFERLNKLGLAAGEEVRIAPHFLGERHDPTRRGAIRKLELGGLKLGPLARGLARGIVENMRDMLPAEALADRARIVGSGNALRRNPLLRKMTEEVFGLPLELSPGGEEAALGAALNARAALVD